MVDTHYKTDNRDLSNGHTPSGGEKNNLDKGKKLYIYCLIKNYLL